MVSKGEGHGSSSSVSRLLVFRANFIGLDFTGDEFNILTICPSGHLTSGHGPGPRFSGGTIVTKDVTTCSVAAVVGAIVVVVVVVVDVVGQSISSSGQSWIPLHQRDSSTHTLDVGHNFVPFPQGLHSQSQLDVAAAAETNPCNKRVQIDFFLVGLVGVLVCSSAYRRTRGANFRGAVGQTAQSARTLLTVFQIVNRAHRIGHDAQDTRTLGTQPARLSVPPSVQGTVAIVVGDAMANVAIGRVYDGWRQRCPNNRAFRSVRFEAPEDFEPQGRHVIPLLRIKSNIPRSDRRVEEYGMCAFSVDICRIDLRQRQTTVQSEYSS